MFLHHRIIRVHSTLLGVKAFFTSAPLNVPSSQVFEMDWWETLSLPADAQADRPVLQGESDGLERDRRYASFTCTPAQHNSGRGVLDSRTTLWASWVVETRMPPPVQDASPPRRVAVYFAGFVAFHGTSEVAYFDASDTGLMTPNGPCSIFDGEPKTTHCQLGSLCFKPEIGDRLGPFDLALLPIWRGGSLSFVSRLGLRVRRSLRSSARKSNVASRRSSMNTPRQRR